MMTAHAQIPGDFIADWSQFLKIQYVNPINRLFDFGARTVVLSFDNYAHVVGAKNPTQRKRTTKIARLEWDKRTDLPSVVPENYGVRAPMSHRIKGGIFTPLQPRSVVLMR
jgi:hypothetical protein